jgi:hypothetical protein
MKAEAETVTQSRIQRKMLPTGVGDTKEADLRLLVDGKMEKVLHNHP